MTLQLPRLQASSPIVDQHSGIPSFAFHAWWDKFASTLETNFNGLSDAVQELTDLNSDNMLTPGKKSIWVTLYSILTTEQSALDAEATTYGITTEKTSYDNAVSSLTAYLATLTTPTLWNDFTGNTTVVGTTFRNNFENVLTTKQTLLNKLHDKAKSLADAAQSTANTGVTNAAAAQSTADTVHGNDSISSSWTSPGTILSAADAGTSATITIANHTRKYNDTTSKAITGASIPSLAYSTTYFLYYDDPTRAGGAVTFHADTNPNNALPGAASGRHYCGEITTPASGGGGTTGGVSPPGSGGQLSGGNIP